MHANTPFDLCANTYVNICWKRLTCVYVHTSHSTRIYPCSMLTYTHIHTCMHCIQPVGSPTARADVLYVAYMLCVLCSSVWWFISYIYIYICCMSSCTWTCMCVWFCFCTYDICLHVCIHIYIHMYMHVRAYVSNCMFIHTPLQQAHTARHPPHIVICPADTPHTHSHS